MAKPLSAARRLAAGESLHEGAMPLGFSATATMPATLVALLACF